jgi:mannosyltransferase
MEGKIVSIEPLALVYRSVAISLRARPLSRTATAVAALTVGGAGLRFALIGHQGFWFDEANTALLVHFSPGKMLGLIPQSESTPPLYYCLAWAWARVFGFGEAGLRSLSAAAGVLTVPVLFAAGERLLSRRAGLIAAALAAANPLLVWYSQEARAYSLLVLLSALTLLAFAELRATPSRRAVALWAVASGLALATHYYAVLLIAPLAAWLLLEHRRVRAVSAGVAAVAAGGLGLLPYALHQNSTGHANWIAHAPLDRRLGQVVPQSLIGFGVPGHAVLEPLAVLLAVTGLAALLVPAPAGSAPLRTRGLALAGVVLAGLILNLLLVAGGADNLLTRNLIALWPAAALALSAGLARTWSPSSRWRGWAGGLVAVVLCGIGVTAALAVDADRNRQRPDWRVVARILGPPTPGPALAAAPRAILIQHYRDLLPLRLYLTHLGFMPRAGAEVSELDVVSFRSPRTSGFCWWGSACNLWPSRMQASYPVPGFRAVGRRHVLQFTILELAASRPRPVSARELAPLLRTTRIRSDELLLQR